MDRRIWLGIALSCVVLSALFGLSGCARSQARPREEFNGSVSGTESQSSEQFTDMINDFGVALLMKSATDPKRNVIISPASVHAALSMTANGATDETAQQMHDVLLADSMTLEQANTQWASLLTKLSDPQARRTLDIANAMWGGDDIAFKKPFVAANRDHFGAKLATLNFEDDDVARVINDWVKANTHGMIPRVVDTVPDNAVLYLANAVYFKGDWVEPFRAESTLKSRFTLGSGSRVDVQMMRAYRPLPFAESKTLQATRLGYAGDATAYYVLLPKDGVRLDAAAASLDNAGFTDLKRSMDATPATEVELGLPKLDAEFADDLAASLAEMGMPLAFDSERAQFSGIADTAGPIWVDSVRHATKVKVDEEGTEAAAATVVAMTAGASMSSPNPRRIICDRPYLFAIVDEASGTMLFLGIVSDPTR